MKSERLIESEHLSGCDAKHKRVTNLPRGASHCDFDRSFHDAIRHKHVAEQSRSWTSCWSPFLNSARHVRRSGDIGVKLPLNCATGFLASLGMTGMECAVNSDARCIR